MIDAHNLERAQELLLSLDGDSRGEHPLRSMWAVEAVDRLRKAGAPDGLVREVHPNVHQPEKLHPVASELLRWCLASSRGAR